MPWYVSSMRYALTQTQTTGFPGEVAKISHMFRMPLSSSTSVLLANNLRSSLRGVCIKGYCLGRRLGHAVRTRGPVGIHDQQ